MVLQHQRQPRFVRIPRWRGGPARNRAVELAHLSPLAQLRAGHLVRRLTQLVVGLWLFGTSMALILRAGLGLEPWGVLSFGIMRHVPLSYGEVIIATSFVVMLAWIPLRQWPGLGTLLNAVLIGVATDVTLALVPPVEGLPVRVALLAVGIIGNGLAAGLYIGAQFGPGPRDGLMTGLVARTGASVRRVRTSIEVAVVVAGVLLGGAAGLGTVLYALSMGPLVQFFLPLCTVRLGGPTKSTSGDTVS